MIDKEDAIQVINLVLETNGFEIPGFYFDLISISV